MRNNDWIWWAILFVALYVFLQDADARAFHNPIGEKERKQAIQRERASWQRIVITMASGEVKSYPRFDLNSPRIYRGFLYVMSQTPGTPLDIINLDQVKSWNYEKCS